MNRRGDAPRNPYSGRERAVSTGSAVIAGIIVMAITKNLVWGLVTFLAFGIIVNGFLLWRKGWKID